jgi:transcriptional regulator with XRE-family HTH domain
MTEKPLEVIIGEKIAKYRNMAGLTQNQLAEHVGISTAFVSRVERGQKMMKVSTLCAVANALNVSCDALLNEDVAEGHVENISRLLANQPDTYIDGIEKLIRVCVEQFESRQKSPADTIDKSC